MRTAVALLSWFVLQLHERVLLAHANVPVPDGDALRAAAAAYAAGNTAGYDTYGTTINDWDVSQVQDFSCLF